MPRRPGAFCGSWAGVASVLPDEPWSATKKRFGAGSSSVGRRLRKSPPRRPGDRLHRRKRTNRASASLSHLGTPRPNPGIAVSLHVEDVVGDGGRDLVVFLLPPISGSDP